MLLLQKLNLALQGHQGELPGLPLLLDFHFAFMELLLDALSLLVHI